MLSFRFLSFIRSFPSRPISKRCFTPICSCVECVRALRVIFASKNLFVSSHTQRRKNQDRHNNKKPKPSLVVVVVVKIFLRNLRLDRREQICNLSIHPKRTKKPSFHFFAENDGFLFGSKLFFPCTTRPLLSIMLFYKLGFL